MTILSVLIPLYQGDRAEWFGRTLRSVDRQTRRPDEVVIVVDGPISAAHENALVLAKELFDDRLVVHRLDENVGVGLALNAGFARCTGEFIARIDADDLMAPERLATQLRILLEGFDAVGSALTEFDAQTERIAGVRQYPDRRAGDPALCAVRLPHGRPCHHVARVDGAGCRRRARPHLRRGLRPRRPRTAHRGPDDEYGGAADLLPHRCGDVPPARRAQGAA